jgi:alpha-beta hydrolase superfamily lysophospholipase
VWWALLGFEPVTGGSSGRGEPGRFEVRSADGTPIAVWGHSYGANCALGAAALTGGVNRMVLYEPGLGWAYADGAIEAIEEAVAAGEREAAVLALLAAVLTNRVLSASWRVASGHVR